MANVAQLVSQMVQRRPFLEEALVSGIVNYAYLADTLKPAIEKELRKEVKRYAIVMALRRLTDDLKESFVAQAGLSLKGASITITSGIFEITVLKGTKSIGMLSDLYSMVNMQKGDFLTITQGTSEITILSNSKYRERIERLFSKDQIVKITDGLSSLTVRIPVDAADSVGLLYALTKALSWDNVNIVEFVSTLTEEILFIHEDDTSEAFNAIKRLIDAK
jgi:aspartokinase